MEFLRGLNASIGVQGRNIVSFVGSGASCPPDVIYREFKIFVLSMTLHKRDLYHKDWIWLDAEKDVDFSSYASVDSVRVTWCFQY
jgi:hypothetical protein